MSNSDKKPLISIIIPVYKVEKYLRNCLDSVLAQTYQNWEAILVDDGSPDNCPAIIEEYAAREARFRTVHRENGGQSAARNSGLRTVQGDFVTFLDSDDFIHPDCLQTLMEIAQATDADIVQCSFVKGQATKFPKVDFKPGVVIYDNHSIFTEFVAKVMPWCKLYKRYVVEGIEFPEGIINEDDWTNWKHYYRAKTIAVTQQPLWYYTINPKSIMAQLSKDPDTRFIDAYKQRIEFFDKENQPDLVGASRIQLLKALSLQVGKKNKNGDVYNVLNKERHAQYVALRKSHYPLPLKLKLIFMSVDIAPRFFAPILLRIYNPRPSKKSADEKQD